MRQALTKDLQIGQLSQRPGELSERISDIAEREKRDLARPFMGESAEGYKVVMAQGIFIADADTITILQGSKVKGLEKQIRVQENPRPLEAEVKSLRELLNDKSSGVGLMRISLLCGITFCLFVVLAHYTPVLLVHPLISVLGLIASLAFFCIGWINSTL